MKVHLLVAREVGRSETVYWVEDAVDEYTMDEFNGDYPPQFAEKLNDDHRVLVVEIPDNALTKPFKLHTVPGTVVK